MKKNQMVAVVLSCMLCVWSVPVKAQWQVTGNTTASTSEYIGTINNDHFRIHTSNGGGGSYNNQKQRMIVTGDGLVGIGTYSTNLPNLPQNKLLIENGEIISGLYSTLPPVTPADIAVLVVSNNESENLGVVSYIPLGDAKINTGVVGYVLGNDGADNAAGLFMSQGEDAILNQGIFAGAEGNDSYNRGIQTSVKGDGSDNVAIESYTEGASDNNRGIIVNVTDGTDLNTGAILNVNGDATDHLGMQVFVDNASNANTGAGFVISGTAVENMGININVEEATDRNTGAFFNVEGSALENYGLNMTIDGASDMNKAIHADVTGAATDNFGVALNVSGATDKNTGTVMNVSGNATENFGVVVFVEDAGDKNEGIQVNISGAADDNIGVSAFVEDGTDQNIGTLGTANGDGVSVWNWGAEGFARGDAYKNTGVAGFASNASNQNIGVIGQADDNGATNIGTEGIAFGTGSTNTAVWGLIYGNNTSSYNYGVLGDLTGVTGSTIQANYAIFGRAPSNSGSSGNTIQPLGSHNVDWAGYFEGDVFCNNQYYYSDSKLKQDVREYENAIEQLNKLEVKSYQFNSKKYPRMNLPAGNQVGLLSANLKEVFPNLVRNAMHPAVDENDKDVEFEAVNYTSLIPVLIKAMQEVNEKVEAVESPEKELDMLRNKIQELNDEISRLCAEGCGSFTPKKGENQTGTIDNDAILFQNTPNPFDKNTVISYYLPASVKQAIIIVSDLNGTQLRSFPVSGSGNGSLTIEGSSLDAGSYLYTLITDGKEAATKKMILVK